MSLEAALPLLDDEDGQYHEDSAKDRHRTQSPPTSCRFESARITTRNQDERDMAKNTIPSPRTPSPKLKPSYDVESTPSNISRLGFDVTLSPNPARKGQRYGNSLYTQAFETALNTVLANESHLFTESELKVFKCYNALPYETRYLYVRLFLRKRGAWFRCNKIGYEGDIADVPRACKQLSMTSVGFAESEKTISGLEESVTLLSLDELKPLAKEFNCKGFTKQKLMESLVKISKEQLGLQRSGSLGLHYDEEGKPLRRNTLMSSKVSQILGPLIRLTDFPVTLFNRLHIVFYRSSEYNEKSLTTLILARISRRNFPSYSVNREINIFPTRSGLLEYEFALRLKFEVDTIMELNTNQSKEALDRVVEIFESVYEPWQVLVMTEQATIEKERLQDQLSSPTDQTVTRQSRYYARRFTSGWIWTRLIFKGAAVLAKRHEYQKEHQVWQSLLSQKLYRIGRRGEWYDRKALLEQHYGPFSSRDISDSDRRKSKRMALQTCMDGLRDPDTHQIYHNSLQKRIMRLESDLRMTKREKHDFAHILLRKPAQRTISGVRLDDRVTGRHSIWRGNFPDSEIGVEQLCLEHYESAGWKGFHSENSIVTTLFALLFWDILFMSVPGVFQTEFQTAPLDLATDAFYPTRASEINHRLVLIENDGYASLILDTYTQNKTLETWCVGMNWNYDLEDLLEIAQCIGGVALSHLCRLFAEEYGHRVGGIGDLCLWNIEKKTCMFVEVKGPGDRLSETQIAWLDQMSLAGIQVELCHVKERENLDDVPHLVKSESSRSLRNLKVKREDSAGSPKSGTRNKVPKLEPTGN